MELTTTEQVLVKKDTVFPEYLDFESLRSEGLAHIGKISGKIWTDHNVHDPGVTILEVLIYALMDLGYRTTLPIEDLLAYDQENSKGEDNFFTAAQILTNNPTTILDYRKMLIDIDGVYNAWLQPAEKSDSPLWLSANGNQLLTSDPGNGNPIHLNGLYNIYIQLDRGNNYCKANNDLSKLQEAVLKEAKKRLSAHRNLCEDFLEPQILKEEEFGVVADVELSEDANPEEVYVEIMKQLWLFFSPEIKFYTLEEMLKKGKTIEEIFEGRPYSEENFGFIDTEELEQIELPDEIHVSDIYRAILNIDGVDKVIKLQLFSKTIDENTGSPIVTTINGFTHLIKQNHSPVFCIDRTELSFTQAGFSIQLDEAKADRLLNRVFYRKRAKFKSAPLIDTIVPKGNFRPDLEEYYSIQNEFPQVYGIGEGGLGRDVSLKRVAQARQLKGYLLFYDHLLASYLSQLANIRNLFSMRPGFMKKPQDRRSYFTQPLDSVPNIEKLVLFYENKYSNLLDSVLAFPIEKRVFETELAKLEKNSKYPIDLASKQYYFDDVFERKAILEHYCREFKQGNDIEIQIWEESDCNYQFAVKSEVSSYIWISYKDYETKNEAKQGAELLTYLGMLQESYRNINDLEKEAFSFEILFHSNHYKEILDKLVENDNLYQNRRQEFLNHLLARFSERFTDYSLLAYQLAEQQKNERREILLSSYDVISRNRGKAFDYTQASWKAKNTSGIEQKIAATLGIRDFKRSFLCGFESVNDRSYRVFEKENPNAVYIPTNLPREENDNEEVKLLAKSDVENQIQTLREYNQLILCEGGENICRIENQYHYTIREREAEQHLLISFKGYPTEEEAKAAFHDEYLVLIHLASDIRYYQDNSTDSNVPPVVSDYQTFENWQEGLSSNYLAFIPKDSSQTKENLSKLFSTYPIRLINYNLKWEVTDINRYKFFFQLQNRQEENGQSIGYWKSTKVYNTAEDTIKAFRVFLSQLKAANNINFRLHLDTHYDLYWWARGIANIENDKDLGCIDPDQVKRHGNINGCAWFWTITEVLLESRRNNFSANSVWGKNGIPKLLENGTKKVNYVLVDNSEDNKTDFSFQVVDENYHQAIHPYKYSTPNTRDEQLNKVLDETDTFLTDPVKYIQIIELTGGYKFKIISEIFEIETFDNDELIAALEKVNISTKGGCVWEGEKKYETKEQAENGAKEFLQNLKDNKFNTLKTSDHQNSTFSFEAVNPTSALAHHPQSYEYYTDVNEAIERCIKRINVREFFLIEHLLLRPNRQNALLTPEADILSDLDLEIFDEASTDNYIPCADPYSFTATLVLPDWSENYRDPAYREVFENVFRKETPAHIYLKICWVEPRILLAFEKDFYYWSLQIEGISCDEVPNHELVKKLDELHYPATHEEAV